MIARQRKTLVLCIECHDLFHAGKLSNRRKKDSGGEPCALRGASTVRGGGHAIPTGSTVPTLHSGAQRPARGGGARCPRAARQPTPAPRPAHACAASGSLRRTDVKKSISLT